MWYFIFALLIGLGSPSGDKGKDGQPSAQTMGGGDGNSGDTGQTPPPRPKPKI